MTQPVAPPIKSAIPRHAVDWLSPAYYDPQAMDVELRRTFDICHGCRLCFNLCDSFPRLFSLIDNAPTEELDSVDSKDFESVMDACTLCDMCFINKCPYTPPHEYALDFPMLVLRYRAIQHQQGKTGIVLQQLTQTDRNAKALAPVSSVVNWANDVKNTLTRPAIEKVAGIDQRAAIPKFHPKTAVAQALQDPLPPNPDAPAFGQRVVLYATCSGNYHFPQIMQAARQALAYHGIDVTVAYPECCGMPKLEHGDIPATAEKAKRIADFFKDAIDQGTYVVALIPSCALMIKSHWPLLYPDDPDIQRLAQHTFDLSEYMVALAKGPGLAPMQPLGQSISVHLACHSRAQNMGAKTAEMLRLVPEIQLATIERCSGHGGSWGMMVDNFEVALRVGKPAVQTAQRQNSDVVTSECPLAAIHLSQGLGQAPEHVRHPIELFAQACPL